MTGTAMPAVVRPLAGVGFGKQQLTTSFVNSFRVTSVAERLATHIQPGRQSDAAEFFGLCLSLSRAIDNVVANDEVPAKAQDLPLLLKQICKRRNDPFLQAGIMVLMISLKNACKLGWFSDKDSEELFTISNEIGSYFCSSGDITIGESHPNSSISTIMARFYPLMKMGQILASLEAKPGYGAYAIDFHISKNTTHSPQEKIRLFIAQTDNIETSACIISPQEVSFLLNGSGVEKRTNVLMDFGPQMPTDVTAMLKYGTNLLQAVGQFNGHYIIIVAFMSVTSSAETPMLQDYVQSGTVEPDSDSDIIEGPSRISLHCPISRKCIKIPVKGHSCKHLQCFDFSNYVDINSRRPSWRCPHCNQYVCYTDIRVDQNTIQVLKEVGEDVSDVIISADGSWKALLESDDHVDPMHDKNLNGQKDGSEQQEPAASLSNSVPIVLDLTGDDNEMDTVGTSEIEDRKPQVTHLQSQSAAASLTVPSNLNNTAGINQNVAAQIEDDFWSGFYFNHGSAISNAWSNSQVIGSFSEATTPDFMTSPVQTDAISPALNQEAEVRGNVSALQSQFSTPSNMQLQQSQFMNQIVSQEYGRLPSIPRHITRTPTAIQALPAQSQTPTTQQRSRSTLNTSIPNGSYLASQAAPSVSPTASGFNRVSIDMERQQQFSRSHMNLPQVPGMASSSLQHNVAAQSVGLPPSSQLPSAYGVSSCLPTEQQNSNLQRWPQLRGQYSGPFRSSSPLPRAETPQVRGQAAGAGNSQQDRFMVAAQRAVQMGRQSPTVPVQIQTSRTGPSYPMDVDGIRTSVGEQRGNVGGMVQTVSRAEALMDLPPEQNWRPAGRMRGSLLPGAYSAALDPLIIRPTQPAQVAARPPILPAQVTRPLTNLPPHLQQRSLANSRLAHVAQTQNSPMTEPASMTAASGMWPERSPVMR